jgi:prolyl-tRNA synthetase
MFADWELIGVPVRVTIGERGLKEGAVELLQRRWVQGTAPQAVPLTALVPAVQAALAEL